MVLFPKAKFDRRGDLCSLHVSTVERFLQVIIEESFVVGSATIPIMLWSTIVGIKLIIPLREDFRPCVPISDFFWKSKIIDVLFVGYPIFETESP